MPLSSAESFRRDTKKSVITRMESSRCMKIFGRVLWLILWCAQLSVFCFYAYLYGDDGVLIPVSFFWFLLTCTVRLILGPFILWYTERELCCDPYIWLGYSFFFIVDFVLVFALGEDKFSEERFVGPKILEAVLYMTPLLLLLLLTTADDDDAIKRLGDFKLLCVILAAQLLDAIEMIDIVVSEKVKGSEIDKVYERGMIALACMSLLLSAFQLVHSVHHYYKSTGSRRGRGKIGLGLVIAAAIINFVSFSIRVVAMVEYGTNERPLIIKNIMSMFMLIVEVCSFSGNSYQVLQSCPDEVQLVPKAAPSHSDSDEEELPEKNFDI